MSNWNEIVKNNAASVVAAAFRILGNLPDAEDVSQEVFTEAFRKWDASSNQKWNGLLRRIAVCRAIDHLRTRKTTERFVDPIFDRSADDPSQVVANRELQEKLRSAVGDLPSREAQIFCLVHFENLTHSVIAEQLGISNGAVAKALSKAKTKLTEKFRNTQMGELK